MRALLRVVCLLVCSCNETASVTMGQRGRLAFSHLDNYSDRSLKMAVAVGSRSVIVLNEMPYTVTAQSSDEQIFRVRSIDVENAFYGQGKTVSISIEALAEGKADVIILREGELLDRATVSVAPVGSLRAEVDRVFLDLGSTGFDDRVVGVEALDGRGQERLLGDAGSLLVETSNSGLTARIFQNDVYLDPVQAGSTTVTVKTASGDVATSFEVVIE